jgi:uncharacterized ion transporter superfamily protein YfcC
MTEEIKRERPATENKEKQEPPITLTQKIVVAVLIGYLISLIWLVGSKYWLGIW